MPILVIAMFILLAGIGLPVIGIIVIIFYRTFQKIRQLRARPESAVPNNIARPSPPPPPSPSVGLSGQTIPFEKSTVTPVLSEQEWLHRDQTSPNVPKDVAQPTQVPRSESCGIATPMSLVARSAKNQLDKLPLSDVKRSQYSEDTRRYGVVFADDAGLLREGL